MKEKAGWIMPFCALPDPAEAWSVSFPQLHVPSNHSLANQLGTGRLTIAHGELLDNLAIVEPSHGVCIIAKARDLSLVSSSRHEAGINVEVWIKGNQIGVAAAVIDCLASADVLVLIALTIAWISPQHLCYALQACKHFI